MSAGMLCGCCSRSVPAENWDFLYGSCGECAFEASLSCNVVGEFQCDHGERERALAAARKAAASTERFPALFGFVGLAAGSNGVALVGGINASGPETLADSGPKCADAGR